MPTRRVLEAIGNNIQLTQDSSHQMKSTPIPKHEQTHHIEYNVCKSRDMAMANMLREPRVHEYGILATQESWKKPFMATTHHPAKDIFHLYYPAGGEEGLVRVCFFVNKRIDHKKWRFKDNNRSYSSAYITSIIP